MDTLHIIILTYILGSIVGFLFCIVIIRDSNKLIKQLEEEKIDLRNQIQVLLNKTNNQQRKINLKKR